MFEGQIFPTMDDAFAAIEPHQETATCADCGTLLSTQRYRVVPVDFKNDDGPYRINERDMTRKAYCGEHMSARMSFQNGVMIVNA